NGNGDFVDASGFPTFHIANVNNNNITFGNGAGDFVSAETLNNNNITFGNGNGDLVFADLTSSNNTITMGNGAGDSVALGVTFGTTSPGGDTINTGTGKGDTVKVGKHTNPDTFGFTMGTDGSAFTTITGAQAGDHVISDNKLHKISNVSTTATNLA